MATVRAAVIGTGAWGTTLAVLLAANGHEVRLICRTGEEARRLEEDRENRRFRPGLRFPPNLIVEDSWSASRGSDLVLLAVPAASLRTNLEAAMPFIKRDMTVLSAVKGIEAGSGMTMSQVIASRGLDPGQVCVLSGPNLSEEIAAGKPAATVIAGADAARRQAAQAAFTSERFRVYTSDDVVGVELGGALKNIVAIASGISDGLGSGQNAKAALMTRALAEITRLGVACGARATTFLGLSGIGDLIASCESDLSRNRRLGLALAAGQTLEQAQAGIDGVIEGVGTTRAALVLARAKGVEMPITEQLHAVLFEGKSPLEAMTDLMRRAPREE
ncbi:MAG TPA: NAD(P)H-dependent glycerol-3-phosphate dehydrogenase [Dehalococcoidia bacterium]|nr:NAD(P)H-dependent glycerol-3-phosphate dehydrogenase [Dehalococcoidia bacterium]